MNMLDIYGVNDRYINEAKMYENLKLARVTAQYKGLYKIVTENGEGLAEITGKLRHFTNDLAKFPAVGDYVMVADMQGQDRAVIHHILSRKSVFLRKAVGINGQAQVIAANIDIVFLCMSLNQNFSLNRLERYLAITWDSGAVPVIVLTKTDLCSALSGYMAEAEKVSAFSEILTVSVYDDNVQAKFSCFLKEGVTAAFIGSSGVGKSTLINLLLGEDKMNTQSIDKADKGRHTTTGREMFPCPTGGVVIDTPGMRELGVENADLSRSFADLEALAAACRFRDCTHTNEPGCAIQKALKEGLIDGRRLESYFKLKRESDYDGLNSKEIEAKKLERMFKEIGGMKSARKHLKQSARKR